MKYLLFILVVIIPKSGIAQIYPPNFNLISDPSFESVNYIALNDTDANINCWVRANLMWFLQAQHFGKAELHKPRTGKKYIDIQHINRMIIALDHPKVADTFSETGSRTYPQTKLLEPLIAGNKYYLSVWIAAYKDTKNKDPYNPNVIISNLSGLFTNSQVKQFNLISTKLLFTPQVDLSNWDIPLNDTFLYVKVSAVYVAAGGEQYLTIGNFDDVKDFKYIFSKKNGLAKNLHHITIDDISLVRDTTQPIISLDKFSLGNDTTLCNGDSIRIGGEPYFFGYKWNTGDTSRLITITKSGTYWCSADFGCNTVTDTIVVSGSMAPASFNIADTALCEAVLPISISAPYTAAAYLWSNGSTAFTTSFNSIGKQWLRISNACGDQHFTDTFDIKSLNVSLNNINLGKDTNNCLYGFYLDTITLQVPANSATQIKWSNGSSNSSIKVWEPGAYWVQVSNVCYTVADTINITGCAARDVPKVDIPNAFTPNGDGKNDVFRLRYLPQQVVTFNLKIYNRYGQMISELRNRSDYWDGGNYELGVYYYLFVYKDINGKEYMQKGDISLVR